MNFFVCLNMERELTDVVLLMVPQNDLAAREGAAIVKDTLKDLLVRIRTPERTPSPVGAYVTEEELFHWKNPEVTFAL